MKILRLLFFPLFIGFLLPIYHATAQPITSAQIDSVTEKVLRVFDVPGIAVAVIKNGKILHSQGYGVSSLNTGEKVNEHTRFGIASNSKAFTSAALAMLADSGKLKWTSLVTDFIPEFKLYAPFVTQNFTIADLLTHRSGMGLGAGDLMIWPDGASFTKAEIIHNLRYLKQVSNFRTQFDYDNLLYIVAGEIVARASGMPWEDFIEQRIMKPLGMNESAASYSRLYNKENVIDPHAPVNGKVKVIYRDWNEVANAAGGIYSSISDMSKWAIMQMNHGQYGEGLNKQLFSEDVHEEMWQMHTIIPVGRGRSYNTHFFGYGLGWFLSDEMGYKVVTHTGGLAGIVTQFTLIPELQLGIIVFTNQQSGAAFRSITNTIKDAYFGIKGKDRIKEYHDRIVAFEKRANKITNAVWEKINAQKSAPLSPETLEKYTGVYEDPWFGKIEISLKDGQLYFQSGNSPKLHGDISWYKANTFVVKWEDRSMNADAYILFDLTIEGKPVSATMQAISPMTDFSYDFHDLKLTRMD